MSARTITPTMKEVARTACYEVGVLANLLRAFIEEKDTCGELAPGLRGGLLRMADLSDIIHDALFSNDNMVTEGDLVQRIGGHQALSPLEEGGAA